MSFALWIHAVYRLVLQNITLINIKLIKESKSIQQNIKKKKPNKTPQHWKCFTFIQDCTTAIYKKWKSYGCFQFSECVCPALALLIKYWSLLYNENHTVVIFYLSNSLLFLRTKYLHASLKNCQRRIVWTGYVFREYCFFQSLMWSNLATSWVY